MYLRSNHLDFYAPITELYLGQKFGASVKHLSMTRFFESIQQNGPKYTSESELQSVTKIMGKTAIRTISWGS